METYPLIFKFTRPVKTDNYHVAVSAKGRILMKQEFDKWWVYGVAPGGLAESGENPTEAYYNFMNSFWGVIQDISCEQTDYYNFMSATQEFIKATNSVEEEEWQHARDLIRGGHLKDSDPFSSLDKETKESYPGATFERFDLKEKQAESLATSKYNNDELKLANSKVA